MRACFAASPPKIDLVLRGDTLAMVLVEITIPPVDCDSPLGEAIILDSCVVCFVSASTKTLHLRVSLDHSHICQFITMCPVLPCHSIGVNCMFPASLYCAAFSSQRVWVCPTSPELTRHRATPCASMMHDNVKQTVYIPHGNTSDNVAATCVCTCACILLQSGLSTALHFAWESAVPFAQHTVLQIVV